LQVREWAEEKLTIEEIKNKMLLATKNLRHDRLALGSKVGQTLLITESVGVS